MVRPTLFLLLFVLSGRLSAQHHRAVITFNGHGNYAFSSGEDGIKPGFGITLSMETNREKRWDFATVYMYGEYAFESSDSLLVEPTVYRYQNSTYALAIRSLKGARWVLQAGIGAGALFESEDYMVPYFNPGTGTITGMEIETRDFDNVIFPLMLGAGVDVSPSLRLVWRHTLLFFPWGNTAAISSGMGVVWRF